MFRNVGFPVRSSLLQQHVIYPSEVRPESVHFSRSCCAEGSLFSSHHRKRFIVHDCGEVYVGFAIIQDAARRTLALLAVRSGTLVLSRSRRSLVRRRSLGPCSPPCHGRFSLYIHSFKYASPCFTPLRAVFCRAHACASERAILRSSGRKQRRGSMWVACAGLEHSQLEGFCSCPDSRFFCLDRYHCTSMQWLVAFTFVWSWAR